MAGRKADPDYIQDLRLTKSLLIVTSLQKRRDIAARSLVENFLVAIEFQPLHELLIEQNAWDHVQALGVKPQMVFCHPKVLETHPSVSLYYRGMAGLSMKAAKNYFGSLERLEAETGKAKLTPAKAVKMARTYNLYISSTIVNSTNWTLENGHRTVLATMGITLDGTMRNKVGVIAEDRIRRMVLEWIVERGLLSEPQLQLGRLPEVLPKTLKIHGGVLMEFSSEPDISFTQNDELKAIVEIKGGIDPAGALERYGAAKKSFEHAVARSSRCRNFYLGGIFTPELQRRIDADRLVEKTYNLIALLSDERLRSEFFNELFHHTLRIV